MVVSVQNNYGFMNNYPQVGQIYNAQTTNNVRANSNYQINNTNLSGVTQDVFQPSVTMEELTRKKFDNLFPNGEINNIYNQINNDFKIDTPAELKFVYDPKSQTGGGYTFNKNEIEMNLYDLMSSNKKIVGIKDGKKLPLVSPNEHLPLFIDEKNANKFVEIQNQNGSFGFDRLIVEDVTPQEQRKFIIQKIAHECVHAKQHEVLRQTEGIGDKEVVKAWTHKKPKNLIEKFILNYKSNQIYQKTPWAQMPQAEVKYSKDSEMGKYANTLLDAIVNYPPVTSPEYKTNALEKEAFDVSYDYIKSKRF